MEKHKAQEVTKRIINRGKSLDLNFTQIFFMVFGDYPDASYKDVIEKYRENGMVSDKDCVALIELKGTKPKLTEQELNLLRTLREINNPDDYNCEDGFCYFKVSWICENHGLDAKKVRGVISSLLKKGIISEQDEEDGEKYFGYEFEVA